MDIQAKDRENFIKDASALIGRYLGTHTAEMYQNFYREKKEDVILASLRALLSELVGENKAKLEFEKLFQKYDVGGR